MTEFNHDLVYLHKKSFKKNLQTYLCADCANKDGKNYLKSVHHKTNGLDIECFSCKLPSLEQIE